MQSTELEAEPPLALEERLAKIAEYRSFVSDTLTARLRELSEIIRKTRSDIDDLYVRLGFHVQCVCSLTSRLMSVQASL